jgi:hypothetical protein
VKLMAKYYDCTKVVGGDPMDDNMKRIKEKTIPAICDFIEKNCEDTVFEGNETLPGVVKGLSMLVETINCNERWKR